VAAVRLRRFRHLLLHARPASATLQAEAESLAQRLGLTHAPGVWLVPGVVSPMLWAVGRAPRLLVPAGLLGRLGDEQRAALLLHELAHLRRRDHWVRWLELVVMALYWWLPLIWWARRALQEAEEECCDAWVVWALPHAARAYALALVETLDFLAEARPALPVAASGLGHVSLLRRRLTMILRGTTPRSLTRLGFLAVLGLGALLLPLLPTLAQPPADPRPAGATRGAAEPEQAPPGALGGRAAQQDMVLKLKVELQRMRAHLEKQRADLDRQTADFQQAMDRLHTLQQRLAEEQRAGAGVAPRPEARPGTMLPAAGAKPGQRPDLEHRLAEMERKLDLILRELQKARGAVGGRPGQPGAGGAGGPGGGIGFPGGLPGGFVPAQPGAAPPPGFPAGGAPGGFPGGPPGPPPGAGSGGLPGGPGSAPPGVRPEQPAGGGAPGQPAALPGGRPGLPAGSTPPAAPGTQPPATR
jgi:hypothetical protein